MKRKLLVVVLQLCVFLHSYSQDSLNVSYEQRDNIGFNQQVITDSTFVYVCANGVRIYQANNNSLNLLDTINVVATRLRVKDSLLVLTYSWSSGSYLSLYNIHNRRTHTRLAGSIRFGANPTIHDIQISDTNVYVAFEGQLFSGLRILTLGSLTQVATCTTMNAVTGICVHGEFAYLADIDYGIRVIDLHTITAPRTINSIPIGDDIYKIAVDSNCLYVAANRLGILTYDLSNPATPTFVGRIDTPGQALQMLVSGTHLYCADYDRGMRVYYLGDPFHPSLIGFYASLPKSFDIASIGNRAYVATVTGLYTLNCTRALPVLLVENELPAYYQLIVYPNPFNTTASIKFDVPSASRIQVMVFDALGRTVTTLTDQNYIAGHFQLEWKGTCASGEKVSTGVYFITMRSQSFIATKKAVMLK